ncbi:MAG TPA: hypothetical protein VFD39_05765, partial [Trueperaceae bacterium]|nr:hypothetical protein [Trueperaceae bacterium]
MTEHSQGGSPYRVGSATPGVKPPEQPPAPEFDRRMRFHPSQVPGIVLVALLPVLSMFGVLGVYGDSVSTASELVELTVEYSATNRFKVRRPLNIELTNVGPSSLPTVRVALSASYIFAFSDVALTPGPEHIDGDNYYFLLSDIAPG